MDEGTVYRVLCVTAVQHILRETKTYLDFGLEIHNLLEKKQVKATLPFQ
jgi:hypothetical protein